jgi:hypothetical protein
LSKKSGAAKVSSATLRSEGRRSCKEVDMISSRFRFGSFAIGGRGRLGTGDSIGEGAVPVRRS